MTAPDRWQPDHQMVASVLSSPRAWQGMTELSPLDRSWLVAGLTLHGMTAHEIKDRLNCSLRLVRSIRAEPATQICVVAQEQNRDLAADLSAEQSDNAMLRRDVAELQRANGRVQQQLDQVLDQLMKGTLAAFPRCGHPRVPYNTYRHGGRDRCRRCRHDWDISNRKPRVAMAVTSASVQRNG